MKDLRYLTDFYGEKIARIKAIGAPLNFLFITDQHNRLNALTAEPEGRPFELAADAIDSMQYLLERCPEISFVVSGGDIGCDYDPDPARFRTSLHEVMDALYRLPVPVHCCVGNHDDGLGNALDHGWDTVKAAILPEEMHALCMKFNPTAENYYYQDIDTAAGGWRMIFLNTSDKPYFLENGGYTLGWVSEISPKQVAWLKNEALKTDRSIVVFSHQPLRNAGVFGTANPPTDLATFEDLRGGSEVYDAIKRCHNVKLCIAGHVHYDNLVYDGGLVSVTSQSSFAAPWTPSCPERVFGTPSETAFDVFSIRDDALFITRFGAGEDRRAMLLRVGNHAPW